jgi:hypothetical protein
LEVKNIGSEWTNGRMDITKTDVTKGRKTQRREKKIGGGGGGREMKMMEKFGSGGG